MIRRRFLNNIKSISGDSDYHAEYFTIEALEDGLTVSLSQNACEYRIDNNRWVTLSAHHDTPIISKGQKISFKITNPTIVLDSGIGTFAVHKEFNVEGNIMSLLYGDDFKDKTTIETDYCFAFCFENSSIVSAKNLILPATTLAFGCYQNMFSSCTNLTTTPTLPATLLVDYCYNQMFYGCESLTSAPELPATTLGYNCYSEMFANCTSLTTAPELPATNIAPGCYEGMFYGCTSLTDVPELPAITLAEGCYGSMFEGCINLTEAPELPATTLADFCYVYMFYGCSNLNYIKMLATDINAMECFIDWVDGVASTGTFIKNKDATWDVVGVSGIPEGWTIMTE